MQGSPVQFEFEDVSPVEKRMNVQVARELVTSKLDEAYRKLSREVTLRGFRPGKAPRPLLEQIYGKQVERNIAEELIQTSMVQLSQHTELRLSTQPMLREFPEIKKGQDLRFSVELELMPTIAVTGIEGIEVTRPAAVVTDADVDQELERRRQAQVEMLPIEGRDTLGASDFLVVSVTGTIGKGSYTDAEFPLDLSAPGSSPMPYLGPALIGAPVGASGHKVTVTLPADGPDPEVAGKAFEVAVTVKQAHEKRVPALDDDFAKDTGEAETLDELRGKVREQLQTMAAEQAQDVARAAILEELIKRNPVPIPPSVLRRVTEDVLKSHYRRATFEAARAGLDPAKIDIEALGQAASAEALRGLSVEFIMMAIADQEKIQISDADVEERVAEMARQAEKSVSRMKAELHKNDPELQNVRNALAAEKAMELVESKAIIKDGPPKASDAASDAPAAP